MLECGVHPTESLVKGQAIKERTLAWDRRGQRIAGPYMFGFMGTKGDLEFFQMVYPSPHSYQTHLNFLCNKCFAHARIQALFWTDTSEQAGHKLTILSTDDYLTNLSYRSPLTFLPGWCLFFILWDIMHNLFLGTGKDHVASGVLLLCEIGWFPGAGLDQQLISATDCFRYFWKERGVYVQPRRFTRESLNYAPNTNYPIYETKAWHIKLALIWLAHEFFFANIHNESAEVSYAATLFHSISDFLWTLDHSPMFMSSAQARSAYDAGKLYLKTSMLLADGCLARGVFRWKYRPKLHYLDHQIDDVRSEWNPRFWMCFMDEDFMGKLSKLGSKCHAKTISLRALATAFLFIFEPTALCSPMLAR